jgi:hypothetical protein
VIRSVDSDICNTLKSIASQLSFESVHFGAWLVEAEEPQPPFRFAWR